MKRNLFALITAVLSLSGFSVSELSAATDYTEHKFQDGIYSTRSDKKAEKSAIAASKENAAILVAETKSSNIYEQEAGSGIKLNYNLDEILSSLEVGSQIFVLNINDPWYNRGWGCGYWGYYDPFYYDRWWYDPYWYHWDPFWYDRWRWGWGPYYVGPWGPWGPGPYGPDPWWPGYRPLPVYPAHPWKPAGTYATATRGGNHNMSASGINRRVLTPAAGGGSGAVALGVSTRTAVTTARAERPRMTAKKLTPVGTSIRGSKVASRPATATTVTPGRRQATTTTAKPGIRPTTTATKATPQSKTPNANLNRNVRSSNRSSDNNSITPRSSYKSSFNYGERNTSTSNTSSYNRSSSSYNGGSRSYGGSSGMSRGMSTGGHGRR